MIFNYIKIILTWSILLLLLSSCEKEQKFTMNLSNFFTIDKNATYVYKILNTNKVKGQKEPFISEMYMEKQITQAKNHCIDIQSYQLFDNKDIEQMDKQLRAELKDNKLRTIDEKYCIDNNTITINGVIHMNLDKKWNLISKSIPVDESKSAESKIECQVIDVSKKLILNIERQTIHTQCIDKENTMNWFFAEKIGLYRMEFISKFPEFHSQSKNEIILVREK